MKKKLEERSVILWIGGDPPVRMRLLRSGPFKEGEFSGLMKERYCIPDGCNREALSCTVMISYSLLIIHLRQLGWNEPMGVTYKKRHVFVSWLSWGSWPLP